MKTYLRTYLPLHLIFLFTAIVLFLPFLFTNELVLWRDSQFHLARFHELILEQQNGQFFPDIVRYSGKNTWGYGLNFFYPAYLFYPLFFLWRLTDSPVTSIIVFNIVIIYFALWSNFSIIYKITTKLKFSFVFSITYVLTAGVGNAIADNVPISRIEYMTQYASNIVILLAPVIISSFYNTIFLKKNSTWLRAAIYSSMAVMLSVPTTLGIVLTVIGMVVVAGVKHQLSWMTIKKLFLTLVVILSLSSVFIFPFLQQRTANNWANLPLNPDLFGADFNTFFNRLFGLGDALSLTIIIFTVWLVLSKKFNSTYKFLGISYLASLLFLYSNLFPWYLVNPALSGALQMTYRWNFLPALFGSLYVAFAVNDLIKVKKSVLPIVYLSLLYLAFNAMMLNTFAKKFHLDGFNNLTNQLILPTKENIRTDGLFNVNNSSVQIMLENPNLALDDYRATGQTKKFKNVYIDSLVKFDEKTYIDKTSVDGNNFYIRDIPNKISKVQAPITYLEGFVAFDEKGKKLPVYKDADGFVSISPRGAKSIRLEYHKTLLHQASILTFVFSWLVLVVFWIIYIWKDYIHADTVNSRTGI